MVASRPRALVTGGAGFLGSHVCESLLGSGFNVVCLDNFATGFLHNIETLMAEPRFTLLTMDIAEGCPTSGDFDLVVHLASPTSPFQYSAMPIDILRAGGQGTWHALETARRCDARFVLVSTSKVYGEGTPTSMTERDECHPAPQGAAREAYEGSRFAEALTTSYRRDHRVDTGIVRVFNTYGPAMRDDDGNAVSTFIQQALDGEPLTVTGDGRQTTCLCYVSDTVDAIVRMAASLHPGPVNVGSPEETSILELAQQIIAMTGSSSQIQFVDPDEGDLADRRPDISLAGAQLGWQPRTALTEGLAHTVRAKLLARRQHDATADGTDELWGLRMTGGTLRVI